MYALVALFVHYLERLYDYWKETSSLMDANSLLWSSMNWPRFWTIQILLLTLIFIYCVIVELARVIGRDRLKAMFIGPLPPKPAKSLEGALGSHVGARRILKAALGCPLWVVSSHSRPAGSDRLPTLKALQPSRAHFGWRSLR
ncbi:MULTISPECIES: hypothetical protein [Pseudomonas]|jgi:hypothetical protein|uniref:hypothetical protein n=1 Tax=Pseudomonas TaxID=286 RepID=UPI0021563506|nr:hypothetical protein [Pseudomonas putida]